MSESTVKESLSTIRSQKVLVTKEALKKIVSDNIIKITDKIIDTVARKNADYGDAWQRYGIFTPLIRINDKILRVATLSDGRTALVSDESVYDTLLDIIGYALLAILKLNFEVSNNKTMDGYVQLSIDFEKGEHDA